VAGEGRGGMCVYELAYLCACLCVFVCMCVRVRALRYELQYEWAPLLKMVVSVL